MRQLVGRPFKPGQMVTITKSPGVFVFRQYFEFTRNAAGDNVPLQGCVMEINGRKAYWLPLDQIHAYSESETPPAASLPERVAGNNLAQIDGRQTVEG